MRRPWTCHTDLFLHSHPRHWHYEKSDMTCVQQPWQHHTSCLFVYKAWWELEFHIIFRRSKRFLSIKGINHPLFFLLIHQVHIHRDLHLRVPYKDPGQGLLCGEVHFPAGPVELVGFQCYPHGVSISDKRGSPELNVIWRTLTGQMFFNANQHSGPLSPAECEKNGGGGVGGVETGKMMHGPVVCVLKASNPF